MSRTLPPYSPLSAEQHDTLAKIQRMLTNVADPAISKRVALHGYDDAEHAYGWQLYADAAGMTRPLSFFTAAKQQTATNPDDQTRALIRELDQFENKWFPRVQAALDRFIDPAQLSTFSGAFFQDLSQQPEGPAVIDSVTKLLDRTEALATSPTPGAQAAFDALVKRGLTAEQRAQVRALLASARQLRPADLSSSPDIEPIDLERAAQQQRDAFQKLLVWYRDWATTFRQELDHHALVRLGLRASKGKPKKSDKSNTPSTSGTSSTSEAPDID